MARKSVCGLFLVSVFLTPGLANAALIGSGPLVGFAQSVIDFLTGTIGPLLFIIGVCVAGICLALGSRDGIFKAIYAIVGGALLYSAGAIAEFVGRTAH